MMPLQIVVRLGHLCLTLRVVPALASISAATRPRIFGSKRRRRQRPARWLISTREGPETGNIAGAPSSAAFHLTLIEIIASTRQARESILPVISAPLYRHGQRLESLTCASTLASRTNACLGETSDADAMPCAHLVAALNSSSMQPSASSSKSTATLLVALPVASGQHSLSAISRMARVKY